jgi:hypothetical protein
MSAAEDPRPVLATSASSTPVGLNGGICAREVIETGRLRLLSYKIISGLGGLVASAGGIGERETCLVLLRVKVVISDDCDVKARTQSLFELCGAFRF